MWLTSLSLRSAARLYLAFCFSLSGAIPPSVFGDPMSLSVSVHQFHLHAFISVRFSPPDTFLRSFQSGILTACRSELGRLEQLLTLVDPLGLCRDTGSPYLKPRLVEIRGKTGVDVERVWNEVASIWRAAKLLTIC